MGGGGVGLAFQYETFVLTAGFVCTYFSPQGLYSVFCANRQLAGSILDLLLTHFTRFYEHETDITPPIKLTPCVKMSGSDVTAAEPLVSRLLYLS